MDIDNIAEKIFEDKPKPKFTIQLNLDINSDINQQFEIISLIFLRGIEKKIYNNDILKSIESIEDIKESKKILMKQFFLLKLYFNSFCIDFDIINLNKKDCINYKLYNSPSFYNKNKYPFNFCFIKSIFKKGKKIESIYNYKNKTENLNNIFIIFKINNHYFKVTFDFLKK